MSHIYPEISAELEKIMLSMEQLAQVQKIEPRAEVKQKLFATLAGLEKPAADAEQAKETKIVSMAPAGGITKTGGGMKWLAAASVIAAIALGSLYVMERGNASEARSNMANVESKLTQKDQQLAKLSAENKFSEAELAMFRNPDIKTVFLKGTPNKPQGSLAIVCCNMKNGETAIAVESLPQSTADKQYQLWAIVDGKPVDMGMIPQDMTAGTRFIPVKNIENAQAFAITLEKAGGSPSPTLEEMYVIGTI